MVPADTGAGWCGEAFGLGQAAMTMEGNWLYPAMENDFPDTPFEVAELPQGTQQGNLAFTVAYSIGADSVNKEAAWVLLQYLTGPEGWPSGPDRAWPCRPATTSSRHRGARHSRPASSTPRRTRSHGTSRTSRRRSTPS